MNDCWPVTSWAIADYFLRPKPAYFTMARELAPFTVGMTRKSVKTFDSTETMAYFKISSVLELWGTNSTAEGKKVSVELHAYDVEQGAIAEVVAEGWNEGTKVIVLAPNSTTEIWKGPTPGIEDVRVEGLKSRAVVIQARIIDSETKVVLARYSNWYFPIFYFLYQS